jgi:hypothetical protein
MSWFFALVLALTLAAAPAPTPTPVPAPQEEVVRGQLLTIAQGYLIFTTGDAVRLRDDAQLAPKLRLGETIRVYLDKTTHLAREVDAAPGPLATDVDAANLPRAYVAVSPASARTVQNGAGTGAGQLVTVRIDVTVPADTPPTDDVYLATDRSSFSAAELRMNRVDAYHWTVTLPAVVGATLQYEFTRGNYSSIERDRSGSVLAPRKLDIHGNVTTDDKVSRWADIS